MRCLFANCEALSDNCNCMTLCFPVIFYPDNGTRGGFSVDISANGSSTAGKTSSLICSATLYPNRNPPLPDPSIPSPTFEWLYGSDGNAPLPSGLNF